MSESGPRLHAVQSLAKILPHGTEGGKEFARVVGLLLFQDAKRTGLEFNLFDDASGDYEGMDSFSRPKKSQLITGYQYKFFPSPLSDKHRSEIRRSVQNAADRSQTQHGRTLEKYVIVTPDDLKNSASRQAGGDVDWFESLRVEFSKVFELEHVGHMKLQNLFLQNQPLCLYYYPSLLHSGVLRRRTIQEIRSQYDTNLKARYGRIEFVGMSVYKEEASRRVPLDKIYIPLSVLPERAPEESEDTPRIDPTVFLSAGAKTVVLGDPGSGKSTLVAFLALVGITEDLQKRCKISSDDRLTLIIVLRRYADELKTRANLSIIDYLVEVVKADFSLEYFNKEFLEFYFESGRTIILFDGLDELSSSHLKSVVRRRIEIFNSTYPENTVIVTSRIVGYEAEVRFDESFRHFRVAKLRTPEIEHFIKDWYAARIADETERNVNASDLVRVITNPENDSIRDLARNPLLLTIVALVHRIDAVLPDQRVVLYQKCIETLLNTWNRAKRKDEELAKGRVERRNRLRVEAIAYWMHRRSDQETGRAIARHDDILEFLTSYIADNESPTQVDPAEDQAEVFLEFVKSGAGLLIEAGDGLYSFIHLTFQEYLSATHLTSDGEIGGTQGIWNAIGNNVCNPRWREVVRLLVASMRSINGQKFFVDKLLENSELNSSRDGVLLLIGFLRDGIEPAEHRASLIINIALNAMQKITQSDDLHSVQLSIKAWVEKDAANRRTALSTLEEAAQNWAGESLIKLILIQLVIGLGVASDTNVQRLLGDQSVTFQASTYLRLVNEPMGFSEDIVDLGQMSGLHDLWATQSPERNIAAAIGQGLLILIEPRKAMERMLHRELLLLGTAGYGPHIDHFFNTVCVAISMIKPPGQLVTAVRSALKRGRNRSERLVGVLRDNLPGLFLVDDKVDHGTTIGMTNLLREKLEKGLERFQDLAEINRSRSAKQRDPGQDSEVTLIRTEFRSKLENDPSSFLRMVLASEIFDDLIFPSTSAGLGLGSEIHWKEALRVALSRCIPSALATYLDPESWAQLEGRLSAGSRDPVDLNFATWLILLDIWIWNNGGYTVAEESPLKGIVAASKSLDFAPLEFVWHVRGACMKEIASQEWLQTAASNKQSQTVHLLRVIGWPAGYGDRTGPSRVKRVTNPRRLSQRTS